MVVIVKYCLDQVDRFLDHRDCVKTVMTATDVMIVADLTIVADATIVADLITATKRNGNMEEYILQSIDT